MFDGNIKAIMQDLLRAVKLDIRKQYAFPIKAKVLKVYLEANQYFVDVQPLRNNEDEWEAEQADGTKKKIPAIKKIKLDTLCNGPTRGVFCLPVKDSIVRVSFWNADWNWPFVDAVLWSETPVLEEHEVAIYRDETTSIRMRENGDIEVVTAAKVYVEAAEVEVKAETVLVDADSVDLAGTGGPDVARVGDEVEVDGKTGTITSGSSKVRAN